MTRYLLDSDVFISAHQTFFAMDICPGFWGWLERMKKADRIVSIARVLDELSEMGDELSDWAKSRDNGWFLPENDLMIQSLPLVANWVETAVMSGSPYTMQAKTQFFGPAADQFLIAYAKGNGLTLVTQETNSKKSTQVKIPAVCQGVNVPCLNLYDLLRAEGVVMRTCGAADCTSDCHG